MRRIVHHKLGSPAAVLAVEAVSLNRTVPTGAVVIVKVTDAPIHPGDLLGVAGSPAAGKPAQISASGRVPGFEGAGIIEAIGEGVDSSAGLSIGDRVAFFPASGAWSEFVTVAAGSLVPIPDELPAKFAAQMLINTITASVMLRAGHSALPADRMQNVTVLQTGAASAVGKILTTLLAEHGVTVLRLVRSPESAVALEKAIPLGPVFATQAQDWKASLRTEIGTREILVAFDGVGGDLLPDLIDLLGEGATIVNYGSLGGAATDIRQLPPAGVSILGRSIGRWRHDPPAVRLADIATALRLATSRPDLFVVAGEYAPDDLQAALAHMGRADKAGTVLLKFNAIPVEGLS